MAIYQKQGFLGPYPKLRIHLTNFTSSIGFEYKDRQTVVTIKLSRAGKPIGVVPIQLTSFITGTFYQ